LRSIAITSLTVAAEAREKNERRERKRKGKEKRKGKFTCAPWSSLKTKA